MMTNASTSTPHSAAMLGYSGLIPFIVFTMAMFIDAPRSTIWRDALLSYGSVILSFVGALHWAFAMQSETLEPLVQKQRYAWSVIPALVAWVALLIPPLVAGLLLSVFFLLHYDQDRRFNRISPLPQWYLPLRLKLTLVASSCVALGAITAP